MSMPIKNRNFSTILFSGLPLILLLIAVTLAVWFIMQPKTLRTGDSLVVHQVVRDISGKSSIPARLGRSFWEDGLILRDPFFRNKAATVKEQPQPIEIGGSGEVLQELVEITLTTIAQGAGGKYCLVNGKFFHEKEKGTGFTVEQIHPDQVIFSTARQNFVLKPGQKVTLDSGRILNNVPQSD